MSLEIITAPVDTLLTTVEAVRCELNVSDTDVDDQIEGFIQQASDMITRECDRTFAQTEVKEGLGTVGNPELFLSLTPLGAITLVEHKGTAVTDYTISDNEIGLLFRETGWFTSEMGWAASMNGHPSGYKKEDWFFTYTGGYILPNWDNLGAWSGGDRTLPHDLERACIEISKTIYNQALSTPGIDGNIKRYRIGEVDISWDREGGLVSNNAQNIINFYKRSF